ncbi:MAG: hypothetical protein WDM88_01565 [Galbitalea sp.]
MSPHTVLIATICALGFSARSEFMAATVAVFRAPSATPRSLLLPEIRMMSGWSVAALVTSVAKVLPQSEREPTVTNPAPLQARFVILQPVAAPMSSGQAARAAARSPS